MKPTGIMVLNRDGLENNDNWATPKWLYDTLDSVYNFDFDPCPLNYMIDAMDIEWGISNFVNPPYNKIDKPKFIDKAYHQWMLGKRSVLLLPSATGTKQFQKIILPVCKIRLGWKEWIELKDSTYLCGESLVIFMEGRIAFEGVNTKGEYVTKNKGKHDSMIVVFNR